MDFWKKLRGGWQGSYDVKNLVSARLYEPGADTSSRQIICDIDKTYLETEFESWLKMARIVFEDAGDKVTVRGASEVLIAARWAEVERHFAQHGTFSAPRALHFVSSSPPQLRPVLEAKLLQDGLDWNSDTFKDQSYNLKMRRVDLLRHHVGYKSLAILKILKNAPEGARFYCLGDNAETDGYIYLGLKLLTEGRLSPTGYGKYLSLSGVDTDAVAEILTQLDLKPVCIERIMIRQVSGYPTISMPPLTAPICFFGHFFQVACAFVLDGLIPQESFRYLAQRFHNMHGVPLSEIKAGLSFLKTNLGRTEIDEFTPVENAEFGRLAAGEPHEHGDIWQSIQRVGKPELPLTEDEIIELTKTWLHLIEMERLRRKGS